jgi:hypothetical protein
MLITSTNTEKAMAKYIYPLGICRSSPSATRAVPISRRKLKARILKVG